MKIDRRVANRQDETTTAPKTDVVILLVEDEVAVSREVTKILKSQGYRVVQVYSKAQAIEKLQSASAELILLDLGLPDGDGLDVLRYANQNHLTAPTLILSNLGTVPRTVEAMQLGAEDFLEKPVPEARLLLAVRNTLERKRLIREVDSLRDGVENLQDRIVLEALPGTSPAIEEFRLFVTRTAGEDLPVLLTGKPGSGKTHVARLFHTLSGRSGRFIDIACPHLSHDLFEAELFGSKRGAFTGAVDKPGLIEEAAGGTLFLDEISEMRPDTQAKLLQVLSERGTYRRVGATEEKTLKARIITATNRDLAEAAASGSFRLDLLHRLSTLKMHMPSLSERVDDIPYFATLFMERSCKKAAIPLLRFAPDAEAALREHDWPGNVRELEQVVQRLRIFATDSQVTRRDVIEAIGKDGRGAAIEATADLALDEAKSEFERSYILKSLEKHSGHVRETAKALGIDRTTLWRKLNRYGVSGEDS